MITKVDRAALLIHLEYAGQRTPVTDRAAQLIAAIYKHREYINKLEGGKLDFDWAPGSERVKVGIHKFMWE